MSETKTTGNSDGSRFTSLDNMMAEKDREIAEKDEQLRLVRESFSNEWAAHKDEIETLRSEVKALKAEQKRIETLLDEARTIIGMYRDGYYDAVNDDAESFLERTANKATDKDSLSDDLAAVDEGDMTP